MIRAPGRNISVGEACMKRNPDLFKKLDPDAQAILNNTPLKKKRIRQSSKPLLNPLEQEFYDYIYGELAPFGHPIIWLQSVRFKLGNGIWYKPDLMHCRPNGRSTCYEVKGKHAHRGGFENLKVAAHKYPEIQWMLVWKAAGVWNAQEVLP